MMNPPVKRTRVQETRRFLAPYASTILFGIGLIVGFVMGKL